jgi:hypothetical protein
MTTEQPRPSASRSAEILRPATPARAEGGPDKTDDPHETTREAAAGGPTARSSTDRPSTDKSATDRSATAKPIGDKQAIGKAAVGKSISDEPAVGKAAVGKPSADKPSLGKAAVGKPAANRPATGKATTDQPAADKAAAGKTATDRPAADKTTVGKPAGDKPGADKTAGDKADAEKPAAGQAGKSATKKATRKEPLPTERPPGAPPDPWSAFASTADRGPGWFRRATRRVLRTFVHEYALVTYAGLLLAVALTWPTLRYPQHTLPQDAWDPARQAWQIAWGGHILLTDPVRLWQSNAFFPGTNSFAFGDSLLGYAPVGMLGEGPMAAILRYNILFVLAHALLAIGGYALVRQLGAGRTGAAVAAAAIAYAPWRLAQEGHLDIVSAGGIPLALAMLARGHGFSLRHGFRHQRRHAGWAAAGWLVAAWQVSLGFSLGLPFLGVLGLILVALIIGVPIRWLRRPTQRPVLGWRLVYADMLGPVIVAGVAGLIALPYFKTPDTSTAKTEIAFFSPPLRSLLIGPAESRIWGAPHEVPRSSLSWPAEMGLLPGFVLYALALAGLAFSIWTLWQRLFLLVALAATIILILGTNFFEGRWTYLPIFGHLPASLGLRIPGRLMLWATLLLAILAAGAVAEFVRRAENLSAQRIPPWPGPWLRLATLVPLALVLVEGWNATAHPIVPAQPTAMRTVTGPMLVLPTSPLTDQTVMLWSTTRFQQIANGSGGFATAHQNELRRNVATFPDAASIQYLRSQGINTVLLLRSEVAGTSWERAGDTPVDSLGIRREDIDDAVIFRLD